LLNSIERLRDGIFIANIAGNGDPGRTSLGDLVDYPLRGGFVFIKDRDSGASL
jgi:hypothetical protein